MNLRVLYFAQLKESAGIPYEELETTAATPSAVYEELADRHGFQLEAHNLRAAVNNEFVPMDHPLHTGDELAFIPPVSGG